LAFYFSNVHDIPTKLKFMEWSKKYGEQSITYNKLDDCKVYLIATSESLQSCMVVVTYFFILCTVLTPTYHWFKKNMAGRKIGSRYPSLSSIIDGPQTTSQNLSQRFH